MTKLLLLTAVLASFAFGQVSLTAQPPPPVTVAGGIAVGARGGSTLYYWVIARYPAGAAQPSAPAVVPNTVGEFNLSVSNYVTVNWSAMPGATGYDVLRSSSPVYPASPSCSCAVVLNTAGTSVNDTGSALSAYPPGGLNAAVPVNGYLTINNRDEALPYVNLQLLSLRLNELSRLGLISGTPAENDCLKFTGGRLASSGAPCGSGGDPNMVTAAGTLSSDAPVIGAGAKAVGVGSRSGNTTEFATQSGAKTVNKQVTYDASGNLVASPYDVGAASGSSTSQVSSTATVVTIAAGGAAALNTLTGVMTSTPLASATITRTTPNAESGTIRVAIEYNNGSPQNKCYFSTAGGDGLLTPGNYSLSGVTCAAGDEFGVYDYQLATVAVSAGNISVTPVDLRQTVQLWAFQQDTGVLIVGNKIKVDPAVVPLKAGATTGMAVGSLAGDPSAPNNGELWYDSTAHELTARINGINVSLGAGGTPGGASGNVQYNNAGAFAGSSDYAWDNTNKLLTVARNSSTSFPIVRLSNTAALGTNNGSRFEACHDNSPGLNCLMLERAWTNPDGAGAANWTRLFSYFSGVPATYQLIGRKDGTSNQVHLGGSANATLGFASFSDTGAPRFLNAPTAGLGLVSIQGAPPELTGQTGDVAAQILLAASHTAGMYRVCGFVSVTAAGTGSTAAWTVSWRSPASGSDLTHNIFWSAGAAETDTFSVAATNEFNVCKVLRSTGASAIALNPGDMNTATYTTAWTVERLR